MVACEWNGFYISRIDADCEKKRQKKKGSKQDAAFKLGKGRSQKTVVPGDLAEETVKEMVGMEERDLRPKAKKDRQRAKSERVPKKTRLGMQTKIMMGVSRKRTLLWKQQGQRPRLKYKPRGRKEKQNLQLRWLRRNS